MESDDDPLLIKFIVSSLEYERLKYFESKCSDLSAELEKLKSQIKTNQIGEGNYIVPSTDDNPLETPALIENSSKEKPLLNYSVQLTKNDDNDIFEQRELLRLIDDKNKSNAKLLLDKLDSRGSELTWNSSGRIFIDKISIPNSNIFTIFPHLFHSTLPKEQIIGLKEILLKIEFMGLSSLILLKSSSFDELPKSETLESAGKRDNDEHLKTLSQTVNNPSILSDDLQNSTFSSTSTSTEAWWFLN